jgi:hypothetical protein
MITVLFICVPGIVIGLAGAAYRAGKE